MTLVHINIPRGYYIGQVRRRGARRWQTVTGKCKTAERAMSRAVNVMAGYQRARCLFCDVDGWYGATVVLEASR